MAIMDIHPIESGYRPIPEPPKKPSIGKVEKPGEMKRDPPKKHPGDKDKKRTPSLDPDVGKGVDADA